MLKRKKPPPEPTRLTLLDRMVIPLLTALVAFGASYLAAVIGADTQQVTLAEQRRKEDRDKRSEVYMAYLDALGDYAPVFHAAVRCFRDSAPVGHVAAMPTKCREAMAADPKPLRQFKLTYNRVLVFGSATVIRKVRLLHDAVLVFEPETDRATVTIPDPPVNREPAPTSPPSNAVTVPYTPGEAADKFDANYRAAFGDFVNAMCADVSADPDARCTR